MSKLSAAGFLLWGLASLASATPQARGRVEPSSGVPTRFISERFGFSVKVPAGWPVFVGSDTPVFFNFPPSELGPGLSLPKGGATIAMIAQEDLHGKRRTATESEWAAEEAASSRGVSTGHIEVPPTSGVSDAVTVSCDLAAYALDDQKQRELSVYWRFRGGLFAAHLRYVKGDPRAPQYESILLDVVRSIRPLQPESGSSLR